MKNCFCDLILIFKARAREIKEVSFSREIEKFRQIYMDLHRDSLRSYLEYNNKNECVFVYTMAECNDPMDYPENCRIRDMEGCDSYEDFKEEINNFCLANTKEKVFIARFHKTANTAPLAKAIVDQYKDELNALKKRVVFIFYISLEILKKNLQYDIPLFKINNFVTEWDSIVIDKHCSEVFDIFTLSEKDTVQLVEYLKIDWKGLIEELKKGENHFEKKTLIYWLGLIEELNKGESHLEKEALIVWKGLMEELNKGESNLEKKALVLQNCIENKYLRGLDWLKGFLEMRFANYESEESKDGVFEALYKFLKKILFSHLIVELIRFKNLNVETSFNRVWELESKKGPNDQLLLKIWMRQYLEINKKKKKLQTNGLDFIFSDIIYNIISRCISLEEQEIEKIILSMINVELKLELEEEECLLQNDCSLLLGDLSLIRLSLHTKIETHEMVLLKFKTLACEILKNLPFKDKIQRLLVCYDWLQKNTACLEFLYEIAIIPCQSDEIFNVFYENLKGIIKERQIHDFEELLKSLLERYEVQLEEQSFSDIKLKLFATFDKALLNLNKGINNYESFYKKFIKMYLKKFDSSEQDILEFFSNSSNFLKKQKGLKNKEKEAWSRMKQILRTLCEKEIKNNNIDSLYYFLLTNNQFSKLISKHRKTILELGNKIKIYNFKPASHITKRIEYHLKENFAEWEPVVLHILEQMNYEIKYECDKSDSFFNKQKNYFELYDSKKRSNQTGLEKIEEKFCVNIFLRKFCDQISLIRQGSEGSSFNNLKAIITSKLAKENKINSVIEGFIYRTCKDINFNCTNFEVLDEKYLEDRPKLLEFPLIFNETKDPSELSTLQNALFLEKPLANNNMKEDEKSKNLSKILNYNSAMINHFKQNGPESLMIALCQCQTINMLYWFLSSNKEPLLDSEQKGSLTAHLSNYFNRMKKYIQSEILVAEELKEIKEAKEAKEANKEDKVGEEGEEGKEGKEGKEGIKSKKENEDKEHKEGKKVKEVKEAKDDFFKKNLAIFQEVMADLEKILLKLSRSFSISDDCYIYMIILNHIIMGEASEIDSLINPAAKPYDKIQKYLNTSFKYIKGNTKEYTTEESEVDTETQADNNRKFYEAIDIKKEKEKEEKKNVKNDNVTRKINNYLDYQKMLRRLVEKGETDKAFPKIIGFLFKRSELISSFSKAWEVLKISKYLSLKYKNDSLETIIESDTNLSVTIHDEKVQDLESILSSNKAYLEMNISEFFIHEIDKGSFAFITLTKLVKDQNKLLADLKNEIPELNEDSINILDCKESDLLYEGDKPWFDFNNKENIISYSYINKFRFLKIDIKGIAEDALVKLREMAPRKLILSDGPSIGLEKLYEKLIKRYNVIDLSESDYKKLLTIIKKSEKSQSIEEFLKKLASEKIFISSRRKIADADDLIKGISLPNEVKGFTIANWRSLFDIYIELENIETIENKSIPPHLNINKPDKALIKEIKNKLYFNFRRVLGHFLWFIVIKGSKPGDENALLSEALYDFNKMERGLVELVEDEKGVNLLKLLKIEKKIKVCEAYWLYKELVMN